MDYEIVNKIQRPWGYEVRIKVLDENDIKGCLTIQFPKEPSAIFLDKRCKQMVDHFEQQQLITVEEPARMFTFEEVTQILRVKGYLSDKERFSDKMPVKVKELAK